MAENVNITPGTGDVVAADDIAGVKHQRVKISQGVDGSATDVSSTDPLNVTLANTGANSVAVKVDGSSTTQPISVSTLPLPTGAATAAKQPALGTAGTPSTDVITVQGRTGMTALVVDGSATTQPVSGTVTANAGTGSFTVAQSTASNLKVDLSGTGANTTAIKVDGSAVTQPVSGTVTSNAGTGTRDTNLKQVNGITTQTGTGTAGTGTQRVAVASDSSIQLTDGTNTANILKSDGTSAGTNAIQTAWQQNASSTATWTTATSVNATLAQSVIGQGTVSVTIVETGTTTTAGAITFEVSDGTNWWAMPGIRMGGSGLVESNFTLINNTSVNWRFGVEGFTQFRVRLSTAITGTGSPQVVVILQTSAAGIVNTPSVSLSQQLDSTNDSISAWVKGASYTRLTASGAIVNGTTVYYGYTVEASTGGTLIVYDNTAASGNTIGGTAAQNLIAGTTNFFSTPIIATTGLYCTIGGTATVNFLTRGTSK